MNAQIQLYFDTNGKHAFIPQKRVNFTVHLNHPIGDLEHRPASYTYYIIIRIISTPCLEHPPIFF